MHQVANDEIGKVLGGMARAAKKIGEDALATGANPFDGPSPASVVASVVVSVEMGFEELDDLDEEIDALKSKVAMQYAVIEAAGIPRWVAELARQVSAMTQSERRAFDASLSMARDCLGAQTDLDLGSP